MVGVRQDMCSPMHPGIPCLNIRPQLLQHLHNDMTKPELFPTNPGAADFRASVLLDRPWRHSRAGAFAGNLPAHPATHQLDEEIFCNQGCFRTASACWNFRVCQSSTRASPSNVWPPFSQIGNGVERSSHCISDSERCCIQEELPSLLFTTRFGEFLKPP